VDGSHSAAVSSELDAHIDQLISTYNLTGYGLIPLDVLESMQVRRTWNAESR
jgi:hypothetical protein